MLVALVSFTLASILIVLLPGPDSLVVVRGLVRGGRRGGASTAAGVLCGLVVWVAAATLGLSALLQASEVGYDVLRVVGACYLVLLGIQAFRTRGTIEPEASAASHGLLGNGFRAGILVLSVHDHRIRIGGGFDTLAGQARYAVLPQ